MMSSGREKTNARNYQYHRLAFISLDCGRYCDSVSYKCNRAEKYTNKSDTRAAHSRKEQLQCSCYVRARSNEDGTITVKACFGNVGHEVEPALLRPSTVKKVIITPLQLQWLKAYSSRGAFADDTHGTTRYSLKLATICCPAAFLLSGTMTALDVENLFEEVEKLMPEFNPNIIVTDKALCFHKGFRAVFPSSTARLHYCRWHILRLGKGK
ncbi:hypothetical protein COOONC_01480 [Cooperia oncophora]